MARMAGCLTPQLATCVGARADPLSERSFGWGLPRSQPAFPPTWNPLLRPASLI